MARQTPNTALLTIAFGAMPLWVPGVPVALPDHHQPGDEQNHVRMRARQLSNKNRMR